MRRHRPSRRFKSNINIEYFFLFTSICVGTDKDNNQRQRTEEDKEIASEMKKISQFAKDNHMNTHTQSRDDVIV